MTQTKILCGAVIVEQDGILMAIKIEDITRAEFSVDYDNEPFSYGEPCLPISRRINLSFDGKRAQVISQCTVNEETKQLVLPETTFLLEG